MLKKILSGAVFVLLVIGFWNLFELLYCSFITHSEFQFNTVSNSIVPMSVGIIAYLLLFVLSVAKSKKK